MATVRERVLLEVESRLSANGTPAATVSRERLEHLACDELPAFDLEPGTQKREDPGAWGDHDSVTITLPIVVRAVVDAAVLEGQDEPGATVADIDGSCLAPFYAFAVEQLIGADGTLGGLVDDMQEVEAVTVYKPEGRDVIGLEMRFSAIFAVRRGNPAQRG